jgi:hypothetical protein
MTERAEQPQREEVHLRRIEVRAFRRSDGLYDIEARAVRERLGGAQGCTHMVELLAPIATTAFQALAPVRFSRPDPLDASGRPKKIDSCYAYASHRQAVLQRWPAYCEAAKPGRGAGAPEV